MNVAVPLHTGPRRLRQTHVGPWRADWLTVRSLRQALRGACQRACPALASTSARDLLVLDLGCGERPWAGLFGPARCIGIDIATQGARPDVVASASRLPFRDAAFDLVFSSQVLEHVPRPEPVVAECARVLRDGGALVMSVPFYWPLHEEPHDYGRFTPHGLRRLLAEIGFTHIDVRPDCGSLTMAGAALIELLPRRRGLWLAFSPLVLTLNLGVWLLQPLSRDRRSTLNWIVTAVRGVRQPLPGDGP